jgi:hypothetical protein
MTLIATHRDYFGNDVGIGDIVLGAKARKNNYQDTSYVFSVVLAKTKGMLRLHQLGASACTLKLSKGQILDSVRSRGGRRGGAIGPCNVIHTGVNTGITEQEFTKVNVPSTVNVPCTPFLAFP